MKTTTFILMLGTCLAARAGDDAPPLSALARMPVKEVTVFKDGHAFVLHQGRLPTDAAGNVLLDYLPAPVLGTFWPYAADKNVTLTAAVAGQRPVTVERTSLNLRELIEANIGAEVLITEAPAGHETQPVVYTATIAGVTMRSVKELEETSPPNTTGLLPQKGNVVLLKTTAGTKAVAIERIQDVTFKGQYQVRGGAEEFRNLLTLKLDWAARKPAKTADVGLIYLQRGIRWIPNYKVELDGQGKATVKLQATLLNELTDLENVTCHLVIGVPTFQFKDTVDPMSLQQSLAQLSQYFREADAATAQHLSNVLMTQAPRMSEYRAAAPAAPRPADLGPEIGDAEQAEDLYIFTVKNVTLKKGERMVLPVTEFTVPYKDVFVLDLPFAPPAEVWRHFNTQQQTEIARLLSAPRVMHKVRLDNQSRYPFTTAPALITRDNRVLGQGMMTYTSAGAACDLAITAAVDIRVQKADHETKRTPNAATFDGNQFIRIDLDGKISLTNYRKTAVELEVVRHVLGNIATANRDGQIAMVNIFEDPTFTPAGSPGYPHWWGWYGWPYWWSRFNGVGRITWKLTLDAGKQADLQYQWHYFWR